MMSLRQYLVTISGYIIQIIVLSVIYFLAACFPELIQATSDAFCDLCCGQMKPDTPLSTLF